MFGFGSRMLRMRPGSVAGIFVMIAMTATIAAAAGQFMATALGAPGAGRFAGADLVLRATPSVTVGHGDNAETVDVQRPALLPPTALGEVGAVPGVRSVVGDVSFPLTVIGRDGMPLPSTGGTPAAGHGWPSAALTPYRLQAGSPPRTAGDVVLDARLAQAGRLHPGDRVRIVSPGGAGTFTLTGIAGAGKAQEQRQSAVFLTEVRAEQLSGFGVGFNAIAMTTTDRMADSAIKARIAAAVGSQPQVLDHRHAAAADAGDPRALNRIELVALLASSGGIMLAIAVFVVAGTVTFAVEGRRRQIALLRAVGATPSQVRRRLLRETAFIGLLAGIAGCLAATLLFGPFTHALISVGVADAGFTVAPNWIPYAIAVAVGPVVGLLATFVAAHRALRVRPGEALVESALPQRRMGIVRTLLGLAALGGGLALVIVLSSPAIAFSTLAAFCFTIAVALLGPLVIGWPAKLVGRTMLAGGGAGFLAGSSLSARRFRVGAVGAAIALVVALAGTEVVSLATAQRATQRTTADRVHAAQVIVARAGGGLPPNMATAAARIPGARAAGIVSTDVYLLDGHLGNSGDSWNAAGLDPGASHGLLDLDVRSGSLNDVRGDDIAVSDVLAKRGATIGTVLHARMADATPQLLRVVAIYHRANGLGDIVLPHALALAHATAALDSAVFVTAGHDAGAQRDLDAIVNSVPSAALETRAAYLGDVTTQGEDQARAQWVVVALMILIAAMAAFNTGAMAASERRRELVLARLAGATRGQIMRALTLESLLTTLVGIAVGAAVVLASLAGAGDDPTGGRLVVPPGQGILVVGGAIVLGLLGTLVPAAVVGRARLTAFAGARE